MGRGGSNNGIREREPWGESRRRRMDEREGEWNVMAIVGMTGG